MISDVKLKGSIFSKNTNTKTVVYIPIKSIIANPHQPRKFFNTEQLTELARSIKQYGVLQPVTVRKISDKQFELVTGERRLRAAHLAGLTRVPAIIGDFKERDSALVALIENIQRCDLTYLEEAEAYNKLLTQYGLTQSQLAEKVGKTQSTVANKVRLLKLPAIVRDIIKDNDLTERHARALLRLDDSDMQIKALNIILEKGLNVSEADALVDEMLKPQEKQAQNKENIKPEKPKPLKSICIFTKAIKNTVNALRQKGLNAVSDEKEYKDYYEYSIKIYK